MKSIIQAMLEEVYTKADEVAKELGQTLKDRGQMNGAYFITLQQLERILKSFEE